MDIPFCLENKRGGQIKVEEVMQKLKNKNMMLWEKVENKRKKNVKIVAKNKRMMTKLLPHLISKIMNLYLFSFTIF